MNELSPQREMMRRDISSKKTLFPLKGEEEEKRGKSIIRDASYCSLGSVETSENETDHSDDEEEKYLSPKCDVSFVAETLLPTKQGSYRIRAYKETKKVKDSEIMVIIYGQVEGQKDVPCRIHDQCFTSEVLGSLKCDCREQLEWSMEFIKDKKQNKKGMGMIIYLPQEGRGIGLANKIKVYSMQELGYDTVDANRVLGFKDDLRNYSVVPQILNELGVKSIHLMSNNPRKETLLTKLDISITARIPVLIPSNPHSDKYLYVKKTRMGHLS